MSVTITAVPAVANGLDGVPATGAANERSLSDFIADVQGAAASDVSRLANPAALAGELLDNLRGYLDRAQSFERATRIGGAADRSDGEIVTVSVSDNDMPRADLHGGPARESLEPVDASIGGASAPVATSLAQLRQAMNLALASMNFATETALVVRGTSQISHSANTLLKGQ